MIRLDGIGHVLLRVMDVEAARKFYTTILGLKVVEEDPDHGGIFMALEGTGHTIDLSPIKDPEAVRHQAPGERGVAHVAFKVSSDEALKDAYHTLREHGVEITRTIDHVSQKSVYFRDPDGNLLEIYHELPNAEELFRQGRQDRDEALTFEARPSPSGS